MSPARVRGHVPEDSSDAGSPPGSVDDVPTVTCSRCDQTWTLDYELEEIQVGNQAVEQFALDHERHTGHYPDGVSTWQVRCRQCPEAVQRLSERPARRWAETHARHTRHSVEIAHAEADETTVVEWD